MALCDLFTKHTAPGFAGKGGKAELKLKFFHLSVFSALRVSTRVIGCQTPPLSRPIAFGFAFGIAFALAVAIHRDPRSATRDSELYGTVRDRVLW